MGGPTKKTYPSYAVSTYTDGRTNQTLRPEMAGLPTGGYPPIQSSPSKTRAPTILYSAASLQLLLDELIDSRTASLEHSAFDNLPLTVEIPLHQPRSSKGSTRCSEIAV